MDRRRNGLTLGLLLRLLARKRRQFGAMLADLIGKKLPLCRDQRGIGTRRRDEIGGGIFAACQCGAETRHIEPFGHEIVVQVIALRGIHGRIELDQHITRLTACPSCTWMARTTPVSNG
ncbi:hypothetical protein ACQ5SK_40850 [Bradyrhizobium japonicum]